MKHGTASVTRLRSPDTRGTMTSKLLGQMDRSTDEHTLALLYAARHTVLEKGPFLSSAQFQGGPAADECHHRFITTLHLLRFG